MLLDKFKKRKQKSDELQAIIDNLNRVLNTKKGFGSYLKELGVGDWNQWKAREAIVETIIEEIKQNVALFEPRVRLDDIAEVKADSPFRMRFEVRCVFVNGAKPVFIILDSLANKVFVEE
jgi:predicted component of type VI protein secretion system